MKFTHRDAWNANQRRREQINRDRFAAFAERQRRERETEKTVQQLFGTAMQEIPEGCTGALVADEISPEEVMARLRKLEEE